MASRRCQSRQPVQGGIETIGRMARLPHRCRQDRRSSSDSNWQWNSTRWRDRRKEASVRTGCTRLEARYPPCHHPRCHRHLHHHPQPPTAQIPNRPQKCTVPQERRNSVSPRIHHHHHHHRPHGRSLLLPRCNTIRARTTCRQASRCVTANERVPGCDARVWSFPSWKACDIPISWKACCGASTLAITCMHRGAVPASAMCQWHRPRTASTRRGGVITCTPVRPCLIRP
mmetsp:Transcript_9945/g.28211  ORF Transcript_9945/g.28211 Transcript_9945/m.28211 type:complete len:229 (-) Transcript_9945:362-1048(-)